MLELSPYRKNKVNLEDYDYKSDIKNRLLLSSFSQREKEILEEILYSPPKISIMHLASQLDLEKSEILHSLKKIAESGLFHIENNETLIVNKEVRKYFESHIVKFEEEMFIPNMEFLQSLLKKVPMHVLLNWYHVPRTSNNIFNSLIEKFLITPQIFQRYLKELNLGDEILNGIVQDVFQSEELKVSSEILREKYNLDIESFEEYMLHLEFNFVCCLGCEKVNDTWQEIVTPFHEWREYLFFLKKTTPPSISQKKEIHSFRHSEFAVADDLSAILSLSFKTPLFVFSHEPSRKLEFTKESLEKIQAECGITVVSDELLIYIKKLLEKAVSLKYAEIKQNQFVPLEEAKLFLSLSSQQRALQIFKHPLSEMRIESLFKDIATRKNQLEIEKSICRIIDQDWVLFKDFLNGTIISLSEENKISLKKEGRHWKYILPEYSDEETAFIKMVILDCLFEGGIIAKGTYKGEECIKVTSLGKALFG